MDTEFWQRRWESGQIGFHLQEVNPRLRKHWPQLGVASGQPVFVPLCGKSMDMVWLARRGHPVIGVELSRIAIEAFFREFGHPPSVVEGAPFTVFGAAGVRILQGDFFALQQRDLPGVAAIYDRAALIALPPPMRVDYARQLACLAAQDSPVLLITLEYDQREMSGPPFAVHEAEVHALLSGAFVIRQLELTPALELPPRFREHGLRSMRERVYHLQRR
ncbi:MAG: thiopurine S-methyltransferase [Gammaproteobacteria bacterium]|nr:thiopurine S-methyltransferase [Gammaproteobacteria bacterium]